MSRRTADEREQRRGLILGLTLAEVLLLLLFLLMLALAAQLKHWQAAALEAQTGLEQLRPLQEALLLGGALDVTSVQKLVARFQRMQDVEKEAAALKEQNAAFTQQTELLKSAGLETSEKLRAVSMAMQRASQIDPNDPPAFLKRAVDILDKLGSQTQPEQVRPLSQMIAEGDVGQKLASVEADRDKIRLDLLNLMRRSGNGLTYPSCWKTSTGQTEYIFDITFGDTGVRVKDATPGRAHDGAWDMVGAFARNADINEQTFVAATKKLAGWATEQNCKFYTINRDATGPSNKTRYKLLQRTIEQNFYPFYPATPVASARARPTAGAAQLQPDQNVPE
jgi:hypothetical protein